MACLVFPFSIAYSLLPEINWIKLPFTLCKINCVSLCESKATRKIYILFPFWAALLSYGIIAQQAFTDKKKRQVWRDKSSQEERGRLGEKGETILSKPVVGISPTKGKTTCWSRTWSGLREETCVRSQQSCWT